MLKIIKEKRIYFEESNLLFWRKDLSFFQDNLFSSKTKVVSRNEIVGILDESIQLIEDYLKLNIQNLKTIFINSLIPSIVISKPSLVLEEIHKTDKDYFKINGNDVRLSLKDKILDQIPELKKKRISLLDIRNISVHEFSCSFFDLTKYYNNLLTYLDDINSFVKNQKPKNK